VAEFHLFDELKRRNVLRAAVLYAGAVWALAQGIAQLGPSVGLADWVTRWFLIAAGIGFPFWVAFAWFFELTPDGLKRESEIDRSDPVAHRTGRKLNFWIFGVMALAIVLLLSNQLVWHKGAGFKAESPEVEVAIPFQSIAVLPLANESENKEDQYFSDGLSEDLITALSQFAALKVISRNSAFRFRNTKDDSATIGKTLGVAHLLQGTVRRAGDAVRITAELIKAADGSTLWSQHYDRPYKDLFTLQDAITNAVATELKAKLLSDTGVVVQSERPPSGNLDAYNDFLQGNYLGHMGSDVELRKSIDSYEAAIRIDPKYARAYAMMAGAWTKLAVDYYGGPEAGDSFAKANDAVNTALALDPDLALAHLARGYLLYAHDYDWTGAQVEYRRALQLAPNDDSAKALLGAVLATMGQVKRAVELVRDTLLTSPMSGTSYSSLASYYQGLGMLDDAERATRTQAALQPGHVADLPIVLSAIEVQRGNAALALKYANNVAPGPYHDIALAQALQIGGDRAAADGALKILIDKYSSDGPYQIAEVYALREDPDSMFKWLDRAWAARDPGMQQLLYDPFLLRYKDDARFTAFCKNIGLPPPGAVSPDALGAPMPISAPNTATHAS
jgi:TolB-like protein/tetratricopeptide (TPR) repeat protein